MVDGRGPLPDSNRETLFLLSLVVTVVFMFTFFSGLDRQVEYIVSTPVDYFSSVENSDEAVTFSNEDVDLMNEVSSRSLGSDAVAAERLYCGSVLNGNVRNFRLADIISDSTLTSVAGSCTGDIDIFVHSQPSGSDQLSQEDKDLESTGISYTCIQYAEITGSTVNNRLNGINCWKIIDEGQSFEPVPVLQG
jgi:hypothetical protein